MNTTTPTPKAEAEGTWIMPFLKLHLADGSILFKPQKPILRASAKLTAKLTGVSTKTLHRLAESGFIRRAQGAPKLFFYYPGEVEEFLIKTESEPDFWTPARRTQYGLARLKKA